MNRILFVELDGFYVRALGYDPAEPRLIVSSKVVLDATPAARQAGVHPGMSQQEARAILPGARAEPYEPSKVLAARDDWLDRLVEIGQAVEPAEPHQAWVDLGPHPAPEPVIDAFIQRMAREGWTLRIGCDPVKWLAASRARFSPYPGEPIALESLPTEALLPIPAAMRTQLVFLGFHTIGEVARAPLKLLKSQFGSEGFRIHEAAQGRLSEPVQAVYPLASVSIERRIVDGLQDHLQLAALVQSLCERLTRRLRHEEKQGNTLRLIIETEDGAVTSLQRTSPRPLTTATTLQICAHQLILKFNHQQPITRLRMMMPGLTALRRQQRGFLATLDLDQKAEQLEPKILEVGSRFGESAVQRASQVSIPRRNQVLRAWHETTGWR